MQRLNRLKSENTQFNVTEKEAFRKYFGKGRNKHIFFFSSFLGKGVTEIFYFSHNAVYQIKDTAFLAKFTGKLSSGKFELRQV